MDMVEYYREALLEAVVFCLTKGFEEEYIVSLDVDGFGEIYKYLKRLAAREQIKLANIIRAGMGADKKDYAKFIQIFEVWLPKQELSKSPLNDKGFKNLVDKGF